MSTNVKQTPITVPWTPPVLIPTGASSVAVIEERKETATAVQVVYFIKMHLYFASGIYSIVPSRLN